MKEEVDHEHVFFSEEPSGSVRGFSGGSSSSSLDDQSSWKLTPLTMSCSSSKQRSCSGLQNEQYSNYLQLQSHHKQDHQRQNYSSYVFNGNDTEMEREEETQNKTMHRFFDEWPVKDKDSWLDLDDKSSNSGSVSTTRLSISIPTSSPHEISIFTSRTGNNYGFCGLTMFHSFSSSWPICDIAILILYYVYLLQVVELIN